MAGESLHAVLHGLEGVPESPSDEPEVECISKGKEHKKYEFGNKSAIAKIESGLIVSALAFQGNPYDGHMLSAHREQIARLAGYESQ